MNGAGIPRADFMSYFRSQYEFIAITLDLNCLR